MAQLLHVVTNDPDIANQVTHLLWTNKISHVIIRRGIAVLDGGDERHVDVIEDPAFNDLPLIIETVLNDEQLANLTPQIKQLIPEKKGQVDIIPAINGGAKMDNQFVNMKCFIHPEERWMIEKNYEKVLKVLQNHHVTWATVTKGLAGYGENILQKFADIDEFVHMDEKVPVIIEAIVPAAEIDQIVKEAKPLFTDGVIFTTPINIIDKNI